MKAFLYSHGGSGNHGCEAIVRGTMKILPKFDDIILYSNSLNEDLKYGLDNLIKTESAYNTYSAYHPKRIFASVMLRIAKSATVVDKNTIAHILKNHSKGDIAFSIGGDNYCYPGYEEFEIINSFFRKKRIKTVLWGCSVEPDMVDETMADDLNNYDLIVARESITYSALKSVNDNVCLYPDPAFQLEPKKCELPFTKDKKVIGINISPHIIKCETEEGAAYENYSELIRHILDNTDYQIALIPHVVWASNDDRKVNEKLYEDSGKNERIIVIEDHGAEELKYIISQCDMFIGARTHSTIAAYSTCVPTLVVGYSVKAKGIAKDIFGTYDNYVLPVQSLKNPDDLTNAFKWLESHENEIRAHLNEFIPGYCEQGLKAGEEIKKLMK